MELVVDQGYLQFKDAIVEIMNPVGDSQSHQSFVFSYCGESEYIRLTKYCIEFSCIDQQLIDRILDVTKCKNYIIATGKTRVQRKKCYSTSKFFDKAGAEYSLLRRDDCTYYVYVNEYVYGHLFEFDCDPDTGIYYLDEFSLQILSQAFDCKFVDGAVCGHDEEFYCVQITKKETGWVPQFLD